MVGDFAAIRAGTKDWPVWPDPLLTYASPGDYNNPKSIDDYWHTAVNGRGKFFNANDATSAAQGLRDALASTDNQLASGSADGTSTLQPSATDNFIYSTKYQSSTWRGDVEARLIDPARASSGRGLVGERSARPAHVQACDNRKIYVMRGANARSASSPGRPTSVRAACHRDAGHRPQRRRDGVLSMPPTSPC